MGKFIVGSLLVIIITSLLVSWLGGGVVVAIGVCIYLFAILAADEY